MYENKRSKYMELLREKEKMEKKNKV